MSNNPIAIRNFQLMKNIFDQLDKLNTYYKLTRNDIIVIQQLCMNHNTFNAHIEVSQNNFPFARKTFYRIINRLENENIIEIVSRAKNQYSKLLVYFTSSFISKVCDETFADLYDRWLTWQKTYKIKGEENDR